MSETGPSLERLTRLDIRLYRLTTESHLTIGAGEASGDLRPVDKPIIRALICDPVCDPANGSGRRFPYIPASSLHGVWRAWVEKALRSKTPAVDDLGSCLTDLRDQEPDLAPVFDRHVLKDLDIDPEKGLNPESLPFKWHLYRDVCNPFWDHDKCETLVDPSESQGALPKAKLAWKTTAKLERGPCKVCSIFGHQGQRGRVRFTHAHTSVADPQAFPVDIITRVAINRLTGTADSGKLFDIEAVPPGVVFYFFTIMENMSDEQLLNFEYGCRALNLNLANLGAHGSVGFGMVDIEQVGTWRFNAGIFGFDPNAQGIQELAADGYEYPANYPQGRFPGFLNLLALTKEKKAFPAIEELIQRAAKEAGKGGEKG